MMHNITEDYWRTELIDTLKTIASELNEINSNLNEHTAALKSMEDSLIEISAALEGKNNGKND